MCHCDPENSGEAIFEDYHVADAPRDDKLIIHPSLPFLRKEGVFVFVRAFFSSFLRRVPMYRGSYSWDRDIKTKNTLDFIIIIILDL